MSCSPRFLPLFAAISLLLFAACEAPPSDSAVGGNPADARLCDADNGGLTLPDGFCAVVVADSLGRGRHLAVNANGDVYVMLRRLHEGAGIAALRDTDGDAKADQVDYFGSIAGTGIELYNGYLYASTDSSVYRFALSEESLIPAGEPELIVSDFPVQRSHAAKSLAINTQTGELYVNVGAPANACQEQRRAPGSPGEDPCPLLERQGSVWRFDANTAGQTQMDDGHQYVRGVRNLVALDWDPVSGSAFAVQHGRDQLSTLWTEFYNTPARLASIDTDSSTMSEEGFAAYRDSLLAELPSEEFMRLSDGADFGWPYCYHDQFQNKKVLSPEYGGDGVEVGRCADLDDPLIGFPGHWAPNDITFNDGDQFPSNYQGGAFIAFHGSWNRAPQAQKGYNIVFVPLANGVPSGEWTEFITGFAGVDRIVSPGDAQHRPTGVAMGPDGSLYVSDSVQGKVWRILYVGT